MITGGCLCGKIRYEADVEWFLAGRCHCRDCQYVSGGEPTVAISVGRDALRIQGEPRAYRSKADSGVAVFRSFCADCGTPLFSGNEKNAEVIAIKLGSLDDPSKFAPSAHIWTSSAQPWHQIDPNAPILAPKNFPPN
jgi:hypothetical protein